MKKVGILGGTFDPVHIGHLIIADQVMERMKLEEIRFMPNFLPPHKEKVSNSTMEDRLKMLELALRDEAKFRIEDIEVRRGVTSYTYDTMAYLKKREPDTEFYFIIGGDMVDYLPKWYKIDELIKLVQFVGVNRPGTKGESPYPIQFLEVPSINISSSMIREKLKKGESVKFLLPEAVIHYIKENHLYGS